MIAEMTGWTLFPYAGAATAGASDVARYLEQQAEDGWRHLQDSHFLGMAGKGIFEELMEVAEESGAENWDGYGGAPVLAETCRTAYSFLDALPLGTPAPSVAAEADGNLSFEWYLNPDWVLSVSIGPDGMLYYAAILGSGKRSGTEPFFGEVPQDVLRLIDRVRAHDG